MANQTVYPYGQNGTLPSGYPIADDLVTNSAQQALSAKQGVVLKGEIDKKTDKYAQREYDLSLYSSALTNYISMTDGEWASSTATKSFFVPINPGSTYRITAGVNNARVAILTNYSAVTGAAASFATGETGVRSITANSTLEFTAPADGYYLSINYTLSSTVICPSSMVEVLLVDAEEPVSELRGTFDEQVVYEDITVVSNGTSQITIEKDGNNGIVVHNITSTSGKYALFSLPSGLVPGKVYTISFEYDAMFRKAATWALIFADSSYDLTSGGVNLYPKTGQKVSVKYTHVYGNVYMRLASTSQGNGAVAYIKNFSVSENKTTVAELSAKVNSMDGGGGGGSSDEMDNLITQARFIATEPTVQPLALLHFTDIHGDTLAATQILDFFDKYQTKIDDMVLTGDAVYYYWNDSGKGYEWYQQIGIADALFVLGNHDGAANDNSHGWSEGTADWDFKGKEWDFDTYFADYITSRGVTPPTGYDDSTSPYYKACYWHKDYADAKVRVIGLDCMHFNDGVRYTSNDQETWLAAKLQETLTSGNSAYGYSVIFLCHYPLDDFSGANETWNETTHKFVFNHNENGGHVVDGNNQIMVKCHYGSSFSAEAKFSMRDRVGTVGSPSYTKGTNNPIGDVIQSWMNNGGKYIAWLSGHTHSEYMYYPAKYPDMLVVGLPQAGNTRGTNQADRSNASAMHTCANLYVVDTQNSLLKIIRVGKTLDKNLMEFKYLTYAYATKSVARR